jgi:diketogulonate reductase-like aldo/keto reductase
MTTGSSTPREGHPGTAARLEVRDRVVEETGATANQVVLAWLTGGELPVVRSATSAIVS